MSQRGPKNPLPPPALRLAAAATAAAPAVKFAGTPGPAPRPPTPRKIILKTFLSPGDICTLTAALESLHATYPGQFLTDVRTSCDALFLHNPRITKLGDGEAEVIEMHYTDFISRCDSVPNPFISGYCHDLGKLLNVPLELTTNRPRIYLSADERTVNPIGTYGAAGPARYWVLTAGIKRDFTLKQWPVEYYQEVVDHFRGKIQFVQIGAIEHDHPDLDGVINLVGQTDTRQLIRLVYHAQGGLGPITFLQHLCAAFEKPYMALLGGREPVTWTQYPLQTTFHTLGKLPCCRTKSCWRSRVTRLNDGSEQDGSLCDSPVLDMRRPVGKCMAIIKPAEVIRAIESCFEGGAMTYLDAGPVTAPSPTKPVVKSTVLEGATASERATETSKLELAAYSAWGFDMKIVPAEKCRDWMDATANAFAYQCLPMVVANQSGWFILAPHGVIAEWNGGNEAKDLTLEVIGNPSVVQVESKVGSGILTWKIPYLFRSPPGWNLLCRGPANHVKDGVFPLEGLVETDWSVAPFSMNWKLTRPGRCEFSEGEPIAMLVPHRRSDLEAFKPRFAELRENLDLEQEYTTWIKARQEFWEARQRGDAEAVSQQFQKDYLRGVSVRGAHFPEHQMGRRLHTFERKASETPALADE